MMTSRDLSHSTCRGDECSLATENEALRLAILGGEDAPGYAASLPLETVLGVLRDNYASWKRDSEMAWDGETANSWKARALAAERDLARSKRRADLGFTNWAKAARAALAAIPGASNSTHAAYDLWLRVEMADMGPVEVVQSAVARERSEHLSPPSSEDRRSREASNPNPSRKEN